MKNFWYSKKIWDKLRKLKFNQFQVTIKVLKAKKQKY
jgi:hypothetical protein